MGRRPTRPGTRTRGLADSRTRERPPLRGRPTADDDDDDDDDDDAMTDDWGRRHTASSASVERRVGYDGRTAMV